MSQKRFYIDDFKVRNCTQYGEYAIIDDLDSGDEVQIEYDGIESTIIVNGPVKDVVNGSVKDWKPFGELEVPEQMRKILVPLLQGKFGKEAFTCKMNIADKKVMINERLMVSVWAAK